jgi:hypothetical protein
MRNNPIVAVSLIIGVVLALSLSSAAQSRKRTSHATTVIGYISDSACGLTHMEGMSDEASCTLMCVKGGSSFVLADRDHKKVYELDKTGQDKAREFAGRKVKVSGRATGNTIRVTTIEAVN